MDKRVLLVSEYLKGERPMTELCHDFGISRKSAYKWVGRYHAEDVGALEDRSRAPHTHPSRIDPVVIEALVQARRAHLHCVRERYSLGSPENSRSFFSQWPAR
jgi:putative transposase